MKPARNRVSMKDLALAAGVSVMTVSRALKNHPRQSQATRERIQKLAQEMGYRPHPYVSALMSDLSQIRKDEVTVNLAVFHFDSTEQIRRHEFYRGVEIRARMLGFTPELFDCNPARVSLRRLRAILIARGIRAIIVMPAPEGFASLDFDFDGFAVAALGHTIVHPVLPRVASDIYHTTFRALDELTLRGYSRIGMVSTGYVNRLARYLYSAGLKAYQTFVQPDHHLVEMVLEEDPLFPESIRQIKSWIERERLDALICPVFNCPLYHHLKAAGVEIPKRLAYVHLIDYADDQVTAHRHGGLQMGAKSVDLVAAMIQRNEFQLSPHPQTITLPTLWNEGKTAPMRRHPAK